jgi:hypothetical protein
MFMLSWGRCFQRGFWTLVSWGKNKTLGNNTAM